jgi:molecular chaperone HtpG
MLFSLWYCFEFADYLQIQPTRAPSEVLEVRKIRSPISQSEWKVHASVRNITRAADDPEALFIDAAPQDVITFLGITNWLAGLQRELDTSWAVLGEVYGRFTREGLNALALRLRRVRSNLDDLDAFADQVDYVPRRAAFDAANPDLLKLLVSPLYDDDPVYGIRELLQNALDAVRELRAHLERRPTASAVELAVQRADVELTIEFADGEPAWVTVSDKGIGMTVKTVLDYFLRAGASLRTSEAWRNEFQDESGRSIVLRSGRFGIGVLAAFLIGDELEVSTRHVDSAPNQGIAFRASLDTDAIALKWTTRPIGTTVRIKVSTTKANRISELAVLSDERRDRHWPFSINRETVTGIFITSIGQE